MKLLGCPVCWLIQNHRICFYNPVKVIIELTKGLSPRHQPLVLSFLFSGPILYAL